MHLDGIEQLKVNPHQMFKKANQRQLIHNHQQLHLLFLEAGVVVVLVVAEARVVAGDAAENLINQNLLSISCHLIPIMSLMFGGQTSRLQG